MLTDACMVQLVSVLLVVRLVALLRAAAVTWNRGTDCILGTLGCLLMVINTLLKAEPVRKLSRLHGCTQTSMQAQAAWGDLLHTQLSNCFPRLESKMGC